VSAASTLERPRAALTPSAPIARPAPPAWVLPALVVLGTVLRVWKLGANGLSFDESFTAMAARRSFDGLLQFLQHNDSHPPLDYLIRAPFAQAGDSAVALRMPSVVFSVAALALFAWWMRRRGWAGVVATGLMATSSFQLAHGREARMYALMILIGVAAAMVAEAWLLQPRRWQLWTIFGLVVVGSFDHVSIFLLGAGLLAVAGLRTDRAAWWWRLALAAGLVPWLVLWSRAAQEQAGGHHADWIARTTLSGFADIVAGLVTNSASAKLLVFVAILAGAVLIWRAGDPMRRVWWCVAGVPMVLAGVIGVTMPFLLSRTLGIVAWAPLLAIGVLADTAIRRWRWFGVAVFALALVFVVAPGWQFINSRWETETVIEHLRAVSRPGDVVAIQPDWLAPLIDWPMSARRSGDERVVALRGITGTHALALEGRSTGRIWLVQTVGLEVPTPGYTRCHTTWSTGATEIMCLRRNGNGP